MLHISAGFYLQETLQVKLPLLLLFFAAGGNALLQRNQLLLLLVLELGFPLEHFLRFILKKEERLNCRYRNVRTHMSWYTNEKMKSTKKV